MIEEVRKEKNQSREVDRLLVMCRICCIGCHILQSERSRAEQIKIE